MAKYVFKEVEGSVGFAYNVMRIRDGKEDCHDLGLVGFIDVFDGILFLHLFDKRLSVDKILNEFRTCKPEIKFITEVIK